MELLSLIVFGVVFIASALCDTDAKIRKEYISQNIFVIILFQKSSKVVLSFPFFLYLCILKTFEIEGNEGTSEHKTLSDQSVRYRNHRGPAVERVPLGLCLFAC